MQLTLYLLKPDRPHATWGLRKSAGDYRKVETQPIDGLDVRLLAKQSEPRPPRWIADLLGIVSNGDSLSSLLNRHSAALLLIRYGKYQFVLAYGSAHHAIDRSHVEPGFGLKVVANSVAASRVISAETRELGARGRSQRTVLPSAGPLYELGIRPTEEWTRQLEGKPTVDFASAVSGADCLKLQIRDFGLLRLQSKLAQIVEKYESLEYKRDYGFLDYFQRVTNADKATRESLERRLGQLLRERSTDIGFAGPDILEPQSVDHYVLSYRRARSPELAELTLELVYNVLTSWQTADPLHEIKVEAIDSAGDIVGEVYRLFDYIVADLSLDGQRFALSAGVWFRVDQSYVEGLQRRIDAVPDITDELALNDWSTSVFNGEGAYNDSLEARGWRVLEAQRT